MDSFDLMRLDGHTLRVFLTVCETESVGKTAAAFDLNQSTISHTIDKMRAAVGDPLFVKLGRGITPTEKSLSLIPKVQEILAGFESLVEAEEFDPTFDTRPIVVGVPSPALMPRMKALYQVIKNVSPDLTFQVTRLAPRERLMEMLALEEIDVAIAINTNRLPVVLNAARYGQDRLVVYYDPDMRGPVTTVEDYASASHAVAGFGGSQKSVVEAALAKIGLERKVRFVAPTASALGDFLKGTDMIATMPLGLASSAYRELGHNAPPIPLPDLNYDVVWHRRFEHSGRNAWIRRALLNQLG